MFEKKTAQTQTLVPSSINQKPREILEKTRMLSSGELEHLVKLDSISTQIDYSWGLNSETVEALRAKGFIWFVRRDFIRCFKYHAAIRGVRGELPPVRLDSSTEVLYAGDIPEKALDRIGEAINSGLRYLTIHSQEPMPVYLERVDPVVVGWVRNPRILTGNLESLPSASIGVVVTIWNNAGELEL
jgi:hypothetical protein